MGIKNLEVLFPRYTQEESLPVPDPTPVTSMGITEPISEPI